MKSCLQKLRSFRYQMRSALGGDNLDSPEELAQKGIVPNGGLGMGMGMSLGHRRNGSISIPSNIFGDGEGARTNLGELSDAFRVSKEFASTMERLDSQKVKRVVELMGQCVQVQKSAHSVLMHAIDTQEVLKTAIMDKVRRMGLPVTDGEDPTASGGAPSTVTDRSVSASLVAPRGAGEWPNANSGKSARDGEPVESSDLLGNRRATNGAVNPSASATQLGADVLQPPSQIMQTQPHPRVLQRTENLFSFISAGSSTSLSPSPLPFSINANAKVNSGVGVSTNLDSSAVASSIGPLMTAAVVSVSPPPAPPPPNQATVAVSTSSGESMPNPNREANNSTSPFDHVDWEDGILLGVQEELDETTLRMEMRTSMDMHRLMRSRQRNQLQLHPQQQQQKLSSEQDQKKSNPSSEMVEGSSKGKGKASDANQSSTSRSPGSTSGHHDAAFQEAEADYPFVALGGGVDSGTGSGEGSSRNSAVRSANTPTPAAAPPPASEARDPEDDGPGSGDAQEGGVSPLMTSDWNWDEQALDAQLFSFMLDGPSSG